MRVVLAIRWCVAVVCCDAVVPMTHIFFRYVPAFFSHAVLNVEDSVAVAQEFQPFFSSLPYGL